MGEQNFTSARKPKQFQFRSTRREPNCTEGQQNGGNRGRQPVHSACPKKLASRNEEGLEMEIVQQPSEGGALGPAAGDRVLKAQEDEDNILNGKGRGVDREDLQHDRSPLYFNRDTKRGERKLTPALRRFLDQIWMGGTPGGNKVTR